RLERSRSLLRAVGFPDHWDSRRCKGKHQLFPCFLRAADAPHPSIVLRCAGDPLRDAASGDGSRSAEVFRLDKGSTLVLVLPAEFCAAAAALRWARWAFLEPCCRRAVLPHLAARHTFAVTKAGTSSLRTAAPVLDDLSCADPSAVPTVLIVHQHVCAARWAGRRISARSSI